MSETLINIPYNHIFLLESPTQEEVARYIQDRHYLSIIIPKVNVKNNQPVFYTTGFGMTYHDDHGTTFHTRFRNGFLVLRNIKLYPRYDLNDAMKKVYPCHDETLVVVQLNEAECVECLSLLQRHGICYHTK